MLVVVAMVIVFVLATITALAIAVTIALSTVTAITISIVISYGFSCSYSHLAHDPTWKHPPTSKRRRHNGSIPRPIGGCAKHARLLRELAHVGHDGRPGPKEPNLWLNGGIHLKVYRDPQCV